MYIANHYVKVNGRVYMKGEAIPDINVEKKEWLLNAGAIKEIAPYEESGDCVEVEDDVVIDEYPEETENDTEESDTEEAPKIDAMAGIVQNVKKGSSSRRTKRG